MSSQSSTRLRSMLIRLALIAGGFAFAGGAILLFFAAFPQLQPGVAVFTVAQGDIFITQNVWIKPPPDPGRILEIYHIAWDEDGFRIPAWQADTYPIVVLGDSYTEAPNAPRPWTDGLAAAYGQPVRNLAYRGFGPVEEALVLERYAGEAKPETVIIGYFEGNDLSNAVTSQDTPQTMPWELDGSRALITTAVDPNVERDERYPMQVTAGDMTHEIVFFEPFVWILNTEREVLEQSENVRATVAEYARMRELLPETCMIVAYFPSAPHIYLPLLNPEDRPILLQKAETFVLNDAGRLTPEFAPDTTFEQLLSRRSEQREVMREQLEALKLIFFDLTPVFEQAAARGAMLYYTYDTHWNQAGHDLAGEALADFLRTNPCGQATGQ